MHEVVVQLDSTALHIDARGDGRRLATWPFASVSLDELQEGGVAHAHCRELPLALLSITEPALADALRARVGRSTALAARSNRVLHGFAYAVLTALVALAFYFAIPHLARGIAQRIPLEYEREIGANLLLLISRDYCHDDQADAALAALERRLDPRDEVDAELHVMRSGSQNAFALPGGVVVVTAALLEEAKGPDEVAGVLAHELEHVRQRHVLTHFVRGTLLATAWSVAVGDYAGLMVVDPTTAFQIVNLRFSRDEEALADAGAARSLDAAGISRRGLSDFFERLRAKTDAIPAWLSNHPSSESRARELERGPSHGNDATPALDPASFAALQNACRATPNQ